MRVYLRSPQDRYRELLRVSKVWADIQTRIKFGFGFKKEEKPGDGDLALFCVSCPQSDYNLPDGWEQFKDQYVWPSCTAFSNSHMCASVRYIFKRQIVFDGNFSQDSLKMRRPDQDVRIEDGEGMMVREEPFQKHLKVEQAKKPLPEVSAPSYDLTCTSANLWTTA